MQQPRGLIKRGDEPQALKEGLQNSLIYVLQESICNQLKLLEDKTINFSNISAHFDLFFKQIFILDISIFFSKTWSLWVGPRQSRRSDSLNI
jgi:hypothetical protein